jgi:hypothetical protein
MLAFFNKIVVLYYFLDSDFYSLFHCIKVAFVSFLVNLR